MAKIPIMVDPNVPLLKPIIYDQLMEERHGKVLAVTRWSDGLPTGIDPEEERQDGDWIFRQKE